MPEVYNIEISAAQVADLRQRLAATRWPDELENNKWQYGTNKAYLQELCSYWQTNFDWNKQQTYLNSFANFKTTIDGSGIHFIHERGSGKTIVPILLIHGWPDSIVRFLRLIPLLKAESNDVSFDVIVPSIPGFGFSEITQEPGMNPKKIAGIFHTLMTKELGYKKFIVHGGDWGGSIAEEMALYHGSSLSGIHLTDIPFHHSMLPVKDATAAEQKFIDSKKQWQMTEGGYSMIQGSKPQTLAYGLNDSPAGICAWIVEKFKTWTDNDGKIEDAVSRDELLTNISIYWFTQTINSAHRIYYEMMQSLIQQMYNPLQKINPFNKTGDKSDVPAGFAFFPGDLSKPPREFAERFFPVLQWTEMKEGGHFTAMEEPEALAKDIRSFAALLNRD